jgi:hypothetical protein
VGIFLLGGFAFKPRGQGVEDGDVRGTEDATGWQEVAGLAAGVHELHDPGGGDQRGGGETLERGGVFEEAGFDVEGLRFEGPEQLLDGP